MRLHRASEWLSGMMFSDYGWGFNEEVGSDADSTAIAILFLASSGRVVPERCYSALREFQSEDGGFRTYRRVGGVDSWTEPHMDVTPTAVLALLTRYGGKTDAVERGIRFILDHRSVDGAWHSFWWTSSLYATATSLVLLKAMGVEIDARQLSARLLGSLPASPFEKALQLVSLSHLPTNAVVAEQMRLLVTQLVRGQKEDGTWGSHATLRLPPRDCFEPWKHSDSCPVFSDTHRLFTTTTILWALSLAHARGICG